LKKWGAYDDGDSEVFNWARTGYPDDQRTLEAWLMDWADDVTYAVHDMDDFFRAGLIPLEHLTTPNSEELEHFQEHLRERAAKLGNDGEGEGTPVDPERFADVAANLFGGYLLSAFRRPFRGRVEERVNLRQIGSTLIGHYIAALELRDAGDGQNVILEIAEDTVDQVKVLKELTWFYVINRPSLSVIQKGQTEIIETLYDMYRNAIDHGEIHIFPPVFAERLEDNMTKAAEDRVVIDLIAGMTEGSAAEIHRQSLGVATGSLMLRAAGPT
jgi:dGTPase